MAGYDVTEDAKQAYLTYYNAMGIPAQSWDNLPAYVQDAWKMVVHELYYKN